MRIMISCGEPSGDLYAGALATEIRRLDPSAIVTGFGGPSLRAAGAELVGDFEGLSVTGLLEVARLLPRTYAMYRRLVAHAAATRPDVFVAIDFPDFNFILARAMKRLGIPVVYYISPQIWAWRKGRMRTMKRIADRVLVIFPFEEAIYREAGVPVQFVGHPLLDAPMAQLKLRPTSDAAPADAGPNVSSAGTSDVDAAPADVGPNFSSAGTSDTDAAPADVGPNFSSAGTRTVALLPGSRRNEVREILPDLVRAAALIRARVPNARFVLARAPHVAPALLAPLDELRAQGADVTVLDGQADAVLASADVALVASGTVTVQAALHECPMVVVYRLSPLTYRFGKPFVHVNTYAMVNLVAGRRVVPELIQADFTPQAVADEAVRMLTDPAHTESIRSALRDVKAKLGHPGASARAAAAVMEVARKRKEETVKSKA
jgi:lipid-A-disaccharide synthase